MPKRKREIEHTVDLSARKVGPTDLVIKFASQLALQHFAIWMCESGEQQYWNWMEVREEEDDRDITAVGLEYHGEEDKTKSIDDIERYGEFMCDNTIRTKLGRVT